MSPASEALRLAVLDLLEDSHHRMALRALTRAALSYQNETPESEFYRACLSRSWACWGAAIREGIVL